jgi:hypothetical protein
LLELDDGVLLLPQNLYDYSRYTQVELQELQIELRNLDPYLGKYIGMKISKKRRSNNH